MYSTEEDVRYLEAILCVLLRRAGHTIRLPAREIADGGNHYQLRVRADHKRKAVLLEVEPLLQAVRSL